MELYVGTSGYSYKEWKGSFYPEDLPGKKMLRYYADRFRTVEANHTFYRMPTAKALGEWVGQVDDGFRFAVKAPQRITHQERLKESGPSLALFESATQALGDRLGPYLFQLPPFFKLDLGRLGGFLRELPKGRRAAFEFRHPSWFTKETYQLLGDAGAALVISESEKLITPLEATAKWGYLRLRREDYVSADLASWADRIRAQKWDEVYVYFKHEAAGKGPELAQQLLVLLG